MKIFILALAIMGLFANAQAADVCVGPVATGNGSGSDWNNIASLNNVALERGNTYYLSSGTYSVSRTLNTPTNGATYIYLKKATEQSHGPSLGWQQRYGEGPAVFLSAGLVISTGYWDIDGVVGGGPGSWTSGHGIQFTSAVGTRLNFISITNNVGNINLRRLSFTQTGDATSTTVPGHGIYAPVDASNSVFERLYFNNIVGLPFFFRWGGGNIIQYNYTGDICGMSVRDYNQHCEALVQHGMNDTHFRWNYVRECPSSGGFVKNNSDVSSEIRIYGNVFESGFPINCNTGSCPNWRIFNNTFHHISGGPVGGEGQMPGLLFYNNLVFEANPMGFLLGEHDYNWFSRITQPRCNMNPSSYENIIKRYPNQCDVISETSDPFIMSTGHNPEDFKLRTTAKTIGIGFDVCRLDPCTGENRYNWDAFGTVRPQAYGWDIGAYEFTAGTKPVAPSHLRVVNP